MTRQNRSSTAATSQRGQKKGERRSNQSARWCVTLTPRGDTRVTRAKRVGEGGRARRKEGQTDARARSRIRIHGHIHRILVVCLLRGANRACLSSH